jgi:hypothetical protein
MRIIQMRLIPFMDLRVQNHFKMLCVYRKMTTLFYFLCKGADEEPGPVQWTRPYFDCGRSNKWIIGAVVPIADIYPRHTQFRHVEYPTYTAVSVVEMDLERIDINQCPLGQGNQGPNKYAGTSQCREETTECEPIHGFGMRRGGYQCRCLPGFRKFSVKNNRRVSNK